MPESWQDLQDNSNDIVNSEIQDEGEEVNEYKDPVEEYTEGSRQMEALGLMDIGPMGSWSVSSFKQGCGVKELREDTPLSFWQSDGPQPHHLDIHFSKRVIVSRVSIFTDYSLDESYTPSKILVLSGTGFHDLVEVMTLELDRPTGWNHAVFTDIQGNKEGLKTFLIRILVVSNHQHGKDTHLRSVKVYSPQTAHTFDTSVLGPFTSRVLLSESTIR